MRNKIQEGRTLTLAAPAAVSSGDIVEAGSIVGVANISAAANATVTIETEGVFELPKDATVAIALGDVVYWDATAGNVNKDNTETKIGYAVKAEVAAATKVRVRLVPTV